ncbi:MAG: ABC transporter ATP-binding protein/permease [Treponema sp.]|nr:ABC transporter ATP-binding protein/permease [Treponema sp.]
MSEYFETEEVVKEYDGLIVRRILAYLKPYRPLVCLMALALACSTLGELLVPVIQQRVIDGAVMSRFFAVRTAVYKREGTALETSLRQDLEGLMRRPGTIAVGDYLFIPRNQHSVIPGRAERELRERGILDGDSWYAFRYKPDSAAAEIIAARGDLFLRGTETAASVPAASVPAAIERDALYSLPLGEIREIRRGDISYIVHAAVFLFITLVLVFAFTFVQTWSATLIGQRVMKDMRLGLFKKTLSQSTAFLSRHPVGRIVTRLTGDVETINEFFTSVLVAFLKDLSVMAGVLITLFILSPRLAAVVLVTMPPVAVLTAVSRIKARDAFRRQRTASSRVNSYLSERLSGVQVVQLFLRERKSAEEFGERNRELMQANLGEMYVFATFRPMVEFLATVTTATLIVAGSAMVLGLSLSLGVLIAFINLVSMFYAPMTDMAEKYTLLQSAMAGGERVFKLLDTDAFILDGGKESVEGRVRGRIEFEDVHFSYTAGSHSAADSQETARAILRPGTAGEVLRGLSFTVESGEMAAIVGYTGAGKTTIINVLTRLWDIDSGVIRLDGIPIQRIPLPELRRSLLPVLQDVFLFSGTVADNISLGLDLSEDEVEAAARAVYAHEFISRLPQGYRTPLSEGASNISSGQRQLISFARVIAHNPAVVILDEATSSIDTETERLIQLGIRRVLAGRTSIVIAHRLSTIRHAGRILVLSGGRVAEEGRHQELMDRNGLYAGLYRLQYEAGKGG